LNKEIYKQYQKYLGQMNDETKSHSLRVAKLCMTYAEVIEVNPDLAYEMGLAHDVGKVYIPSKILKKNGKLDVLEREIIDLHSYYGYVLLKSLGKPKEIYLTTLFHHGFLKPKLNVIEDEPSKEIYEYIKLVHTIDVYDAMLNKRAYKDASSLETVFKVLENDPLCSRRIIEILRTENLSMAI